MRKRKCYVAKYIRVSHNGELRLTWRGKRHIKKCVECITEWTEVWQEQKHHSFETLANTDKSVPEHLVNTVLKGVRERHQRSLKKGRKK